ncbi:hypothetical protein [Streptomyces sp. NPDC088196]|uniref:hypothetical protein n=1 Tax=Streptomyces sp. NPDC088196 TaxID=3154868 RepID=UPI00344E8D08
MPPTRLPTAAGCTLQDAGLDWDVIRVPRQLGIAAMAVLGADCGAVLEYPPKDVVYYFVTRCPADTMYAATGPALADLSRGARLAHRCADPPGCP